MDWDRHSADWPMAAHSRFINHKPHIWHVQEAGNGPLILLLHGAGGATQSWRHLFPLLTEHYRVIAIDLPGQGFTKSGALQRFGLVEMGEDIASLCEQENWKPKAVIGHSAGVAIALEMALKNPPFVKRIVGINAALDNFKGLAGIVFPAMAKTLAMLPMVAEVFSATASRNNSVEKIIDGTGSVLERSDLVFYQRLFVDRDHVNATLQMMAQWKLDPLIGRLGTIEASVLLLAGNSDKMVPAMVSQRAAKMLPFGRFLGLEQLGHLAHEEEPAVIFDAIHDFLTQ